MKTLIRLGFFLMSPYLLLLYWRNSIREVGDLHAGYELSLD